MSIAVMKHGNADDKNVINAMYLDVLRQTFAEVKSQGGVQPRHHEWFTGKTVSVDSDDALERRVAEAMAKRIVGRMQEMGTSHYESFSSKMKVFPHRMERSIVAGLIPGHITHGSCRLGQVVDFERSGVDVVRFFVTNGDVDIDPDRGDKYLVLKDRTVDKKMFYGVAMRLDRSGKFLRVDQDRFDSGVAYITEDPREALFNMSAISTGRSVEMFRTLAAQNSAPKAAASPQPKF